MGKESSGSGLQLENGCTDLKLIQKTAVQAAGVHVVDVPGNARQVIVAQGDTHKFVDVPPALRTHKVSTLADFIQAVKFFRTDDGKRQTIWHDERSVVLVMDDGDRRDLLTLTLPKSPQFIKLEELAKTNAMSQREIVRLLKHDLSDCLPNADVLPTLRTLELSTGANTKTDQQHDRSSLGKSVEAKVLSSKEIPEFIVVSIPVYQVADVRFRENITLSLDIDVHQGQFKLQPLPGHLDLAMQSVQGILRKVLDKEFSGEDDVAVFYGCP